MSTVEAPRTRSKAAGGGSCPCRGCRKGVPVWTLEHFLAWSSDLTLDTGEPWVVEPFQEQIVADAFGDANELWVVIPQGNAKTTLMATVALYHGDHYPQPWVPLGAASRDQAEIMFGQAAGFVERSTRLGRRFKVQEGYRRIKCPTGGRGIRVYAADVKTGDGVIPTLAIVDEMHRHEDLRLYRLWKGKLRKRGGKIIAISTAGEPGAEFEETREKIRNRAEDRRRDGCHLRAVGRRLVYHEWMVPDAAQAKDLEVVKAANPLSTISVDDLREEFESDTLDFGEDWLRLTCNIATRSSFAAVPEADWDAMQREESIPPGVPVAVGLDVAWMYDTTALVPFWAKSKTERFFGDPEILVPPRDGTMLDPQLIKDAVDRIAGRNPVALVVMDKSKAEDILAWLENDRGLSVEDHSQGNAQSAIDFEMFMEAVRGRWFRHTGHREFRRHVLNAIRRRLPNEKDRFDRPSTSRNTKGGRQERRVIDALSAAAAVNAIVMRLQPARQSAYDTLSEEADAEVAGAAV